MSEAHAESSPARQSLIKANPFRGTVVISGASRGLGAELVAHACELGYFVFALVRGSTPANTESICFVSVDLSSEPSIEQACSFILSRLEAEFIRLLINCAAISNNSPEAMSQDDPVNISMTGMMNVFTVNVAAPLKIAALLRPALARAKGDVLNVSSETGSISKISKAAKFSYASSKAALNHITRNLSFHLKSLGVGVFLCEPGWMRTDMGSKSATHEPRDVAKWIFSEPAPWRIERSDGFSAHGRDYDVCPW